MGEPTLAERRINCVRCNGLGRYEMACTLCGDSTYDHNCNDYEARCEKCNGTGEHPEAARLRIALSRESFLRRRADVLLREWLETPFFASESEWRAWVSRFRPVVETHLLDAEHAL